MGVAVTSQSLNSPTRWTLATLIPTGNSDFDNSKVTWLLLRVLMYFFFNIEFSLPLCSLSRKLINRSATDLPRARSGVSATALPVHSQKNRAPAIRPRSPGQGYGRSPAE